MNSQCPVLLLLMLAALDACQPTFVSSQDNHIKRVELPTNATTGRPVFAVPARGGDKLVVGFSKGEIWTIDIHTCKKQKLLSLGGMIHGLAANGVTSQLACVVESADGESVDLMLGDLSGNTPRKISSFKCNPSKVSSSLIFSPSGTFVSFAIRLGSGHASHLIIVDCKSMEIAMEFGPFDSSIVYHFDQYSGELLRWVSDQRAIAMINVALRKSRLVTFELQKRSGAGSDASEDTRFSRGASIALPGRAMMLQRIHGASLISLMSDMTPLLSHKNRPPTPHQIGGFHKYFLRTDGPKPVLVGGYDVSWGGRMISHSSAREAGKDNFILTGSTGMSADRSVTGFLYRTRRGVSQRIHTFDAGRFGWKGKLFLERTGTYCVCVSNEAGSLWAGDLSEPSEGRWVKTDLLIQRQPVLSFFDDPDQHITLLDCAPLLRDRKMRPSRWEEPFSREVVILPLRKIMDEAEPEYSYN